jgi:CheY-like chemotaxis protein
MNGNNIVEILLVEDNPNDVKLTLKALQRNNLANKVHVVYDGEEALDFIFSRGKYANNNNNKNKRLRVILLDLKLPKIDGLEVLRILKSDVKTKKIPVVILTSSKEESDVVKSYNLGVNSYIVKPLNFEQFVKAVTDLGLYWLLLNEAPL